MQRILIGLLILALNSSVQADKINFDILYSVPRCSNPQISPLGDRVAFVLNTSDPANNKRESHLWLMNIDGSDQRQLTYGPTSERQPQWMPDGESILFMTNRKDGNQVWLLSMAGGEARQLTHLQAGIKDFKYAPSDNRLLIVSSAYPDCLTDSCNQARAVEHADNPVQARVYESLMFRRYGGWNDGRINRLFTVDMSGGEAVPLFANTFDVPTTYLGGYFGDFAVSPMGPEICFAMCTDTMPAVRVDNNLYVIDHLGATPEPITDNPGLDGSPRYSPDGRYIAYHQKARAGYESDQNDLMLYDTKTQKRENKTLAFDRSVGEFVWDNHSSKIYFTAIDHGFSKLYLLEISTGAVICLLNDAVYGDLRISPDSEYLILNRSLSDEPYEMYRYDLKREKLTRLSYFTDEIVSGIEMNRAEEFWFAGFNGDSIHGFLTKPPGFDPSRSYPLVLLIHGGPQWCWLGDFNYYGWNTQLTAAQGYVVAQIDPHGSVGYGVEFKDYISGNWGKGDYEDLILGIDHLLETKPFLDSSRMAVMGRSYGGYMANWICGHTDRFKCLVSIDGTFNEISAYGTTDELWFPEWDIDGTPWSNPDEYVRSSPSTYVANFKTPTMVIHGLLDYRVDVGEGLQMFTALQRMGVPSRLLVYPDEGHAVRKLKNLRHVYDEQFDWLGRWLGK